eukprot:NODE_1471_length_962_cov_849.513691_g1019_i0.p3 GENE.NODE_1471_length_962_cov_849.513691_g1019_i0~~NODE_1471_length_962_cov_849.513691_g1019_i0.p3  ORF type:complete len:56 (+),score=23.72 NODE_1471_length_962_cov_849.513691_g1019_i0:158-325(+)
MDGHFCVNFFPEVHILGQASLCTFEVPDRRACSTYTYIFPPNTGLAFFFFFFFFF